MQEILLIDDDEEIYPLIKAEFDLEGLSLAHEANGLSGLEHALSEPIALAIVDVNLPGLGGFDICRRLRAAKANLPILMLTTRSEEVDKLIGFERGADDYLTKPFSARELRARVQALLRRARPAVADTGEPELETLAAPDLVVSLQERRVYLAGSEVAMTRLEFDLLAELMKRSGTVVTRDTLSQVVWGNHQSFHDPTVNSMMSRLRRKLDDVEEPPRFIETVRGVGYRFIPAVKRQ